MATERKPGTRRDTLGPSTRAVHAGLPPAARGELADAAGALDATGP